MNDDAALLRRFVDERSEANFAELVRRHVDLVYTVALRRTAGRADAALALTREVFSRLATTAAIVSRSSIVVGWLHATVRRFPVKNAGAAEVATGDWSHQLDAALDQLADDDRSALLLHYFERRPLPEVGVALNLSAEAADQCIQRAVEKLRMRLAMQGQRPGIAALRSRLEGGTLTPPPAGAVESIVTAAVNAAALNEIAAGHGGVSGTLIGLVNSGAALATVAAVAIAAALAWGYRVNSRLEGELTRLYGDAQVLAGLQRDNHRLAGLIAEVEQLRREVVDLPAVRAVVRPGDQVRAVGAVSLTVTPAGVLRWENEDVTPEELLRRLCTFRARYPSSDTSVLVRGGGAAMSAVMYLVNESRKAGISQVLVDGDPRPDAPGRWF